MENKNLIADYFKETQGFTLYQKGLGFMLYRIAGPEFHVGHFYTDPSVRNTGLGLEIGNDIEQITRKEGCKVMSAIVSVIPEKQAHQSKILYYYLKFGFTVAEVWDNKQLILKKDLL